MPSFTAGSAAGVFRPAPPTNRGKLPVLPLVYTQLALVFNTKAQLKRSPCMQHSGNKPIILDIPLASKKCHSYQHLKNRRTEPGVRGETFNLSDYVWLPICRSNSSGSTVFCQCGFCRRTLQGCRGVLASCFFPQWGHSGTPAYSACQKGSCCGSADQSDTGKPC